MPGLPIPDDWDTTKGHYSLVALVCPDSKLWHAMVTGAIYTLTRGRTWDEKTGQITTAQEIAEVIFDSMAYTSLDDWIKIQRMFLSTITQTQVDLDSDLPEGIYNPEPLSLGVGQAEMKHLVAAITSMPLVPLTDNADYSATGLRSALAPHGESSIAERIAPDPENLWAKLEAIRAQMEAAQSDQPDYSELLDEIERLLHAIARGVNADAVAPQTPA